MASIYKQRNSPYYWVTWYEDGKKHYKSLKTESYRQAKQMLADLEYKLTNRKTWQSGGKVPINEISAEYFRQLETRCTPKHVKTQRMFLRQFINAQHVCFLHDVDARKIDQYLYDRRQAGKSDVTIKHDYTAIKAFLGWCKKRNYITENTTDQIEPPKIKKRLPKYLEPAQLKELMNYLTGDEYDIPFTSVPVKYIIFVELFSGLRFSRELLRITKQDVDIDRCELRIHETKSGKAKIVPVAPQLLQLIQPLLDQRKNNDLLFPISQFPRKQWKILCDKLNINITPYQLKHTFASNFYLQTKDLLALQKILGHADISTTKIYTQIADEHLHRQAQKYSPSL